MLKASQGAPATHASPTTEQLHPLCPLPSASPPLPLPHSLPNGGRPAGPAQGRWHGAALPRFRQRGRTGDPKPRETNWRCAGDRAQVGSPRVICPAGCLGEAAPAPPAPQNCTARPVSTYHRAHVDLLGGDPPVSPAAAEASHQQQAHSGQEQKASALGELPDPASS